MAPFMSALPLCPLSKPKQTHRIREVVRVQRSHRPPSGVWKELNLSPRLFATNRKGWSVTHWLWNNILAYITSRGTAGLVPQRHCLFHSRRQRWWLSQWPERKSVMTVWPEAETLQPDLSESVIQSECAWHTAASFCSCSLHHQCLKVDESVPLYKWVHRSEFSRAFKELHTFHFLVILF